MVSSKSNVVINVIGKQLLFDEREDTQQQQQTSISLYKKLSFCRIRCNAETPNNCYRQCLPSVPAIKCSLGSHNVRSVWLKSNHSSPGAMTGVEGGNQVPGLVQGVLKRSISTCIYQNAPVGCTAWFCQGHKPECHL